MKRLIDPNYITIFLSACLLFAACDRTMYEPLQDAEYSFTINENSPVNTLVGDASTTDPNNLILNYIITEGDSAGAFSIDHSTGIIKVANEMLIDYEKSPVFHLTIRVSNGKSADAVVKADIGLINLIDTPYLEEIFENIKAGSGVVYGVLPDINTMDIFEPHGDTTAERPVVILAPGGNFDPEQIDYSHALLIPLAKKLAHAGYFSAVINYRTGETNSADKYKKAFYDALHDLKAAIRYFRKDADSENLYRIDTSNIYIGGWSAGAQIGLFNAYVNTENELSIEEQNELKSHDGFEGNSGNPGYSSQVNGIISMAGNIVDLTDIQPGDPIIMCIHGTDDAIINIDSQARFYETVYGSRPIIARAREINLTNKFIEIENGEHTTPIKPACPTCFDEILKFLWQNQH